MSDQIEVKTGADGAPVIVVRLRWGYENKAENLLAAIRELQKELIRMEYGQA